jgi:SAM-dependent methyltransferase
VKEYYDTRAPEYDEWYLGQGRFAERERPGWTEAVAKLERAIDALPAARTLDVACGTGFLTRHLRGEVTGFDQSEQMLEIARRRLPGADFVCGDALELPFGADSFTRIFTAHFYGHLVQPERGGFVSQAWRIAPELVVVDSALRPDHAAEEHQERVLNDGSRFEVYKRYFDAHALAGELGGGSVIHESPWFVVVSASRPGADAPADRLH